MRPTWLGLHRCCDPECSETIGTAISDDGWRGPWRLLSDNAILPGAHGCEDPFLWRSERGFHRRGVRVLTRRGGLWARSHCRFVLLLIQFIPDLLTYSVPLFLKRQCDRTLGGGESRLAAHGAPRRATRDGQGSFPLSETVFSHTNPHTNLQIKRD